jgi:hypothetical protein
LAPSLILIVCPAIFDRHVAALEIASVAQPFADSARK